MVGMALGLSMGADMPVCEEFEGEENVSCVQSGDVAVITSMSESGKSYEIYKAGRKAYLEVSTDGSFYASSGLRHISLPKVPAEDTERYMAELFESLLDDIAYTGK